MVGVALFTLLGRIFLLERQRWYVVQTRLRILRIFRWANCLECRHCGSMGLLNVVVLDVGDWPQFMVGRRVWIVPTQGVWVGWWNLNLLQIWIGFESTVCIIIVLQTVSLCF